MDVAGAGRQIDEHEVQLPPVRIGKQLAQSPAGHRTAPDNGLVGVGEEPNGQDLDAVLFDGLNQGLLSNGDWFGLGFGNVEHGRHARPVDVGVAEPHFVAELGQAHGEVGRDGAFAHTALSGGDGDDVLHAWQDLTGLWGALLRFHALHRNGKLGVGAKRSFERELDRFLGPLTGVHGGIAGFDRDVDMAF